MTDRLKNFVVQTRAGVDQFNDIDLAERHCRLNSPGSIYLRGQVSRIEQGQLFLRADDHQAFRSF